MLLGAFRGGNPLERIVGKPYKFASGKLAPNRLRGHVPQQDLSNAVMDQNRTWGPRQWEYVPAHIVTVARGSGIALWTAKMPF